MKLLFISYLCLLFSVIISVQAASRYVDGTNGNDGNNGLSVGAAYKTIQKCANVAVAGGNLLSISSLPSAPYSFLLHYLSSSSSFHSFLHPFIFDI